MVISVCLHYMDGLFVHDVLATTNGRPTPALFIKPDLLSTKATSAVDMNSSACQVKTLPEIFDACMGELLHNICATPATRAVY